MSQSVESTILILARKAFSLLKSSPEPDEQTVVQISSILEHIRAAAPKDSRLQKLRMELGRQTLMDDLSKFIAGAESAVVAVPGAGRATVTTADVLKGLASRLGMLAPDDIVTRLELMAEVRKMLDTLPKDEYASFLKYLFPHLYNTLRQEPAQTVDDTLQRTRATILEIFDRIPRNEALRSYASNLMKLMLFLLEQENVENALVCVRIIGDLHKSYHPGLEEYATPFVDIVRRLYDSVPETLQLQFSGNPNDPDAPPLATKKPVEVLAKQSFRVLTDCPVIVVILLKYYDNLATTNVHRFIQLILSAIQLSAPEGARERYPDAFGEFTSCQIKSLSFFAYLIHFAPERLMSAASELAGPVVRLLRNGPNESASSRKELIIALRHLLNTEVRNAFVQYVDELLDDRVLCGTGYTAHETLRPLAYSTLADLLHHVRRSLSVSQLTKSIELYIQNLHDTTVPARIPVLAVKLLNSFVERAAQLEDQAESRALLVRIFEAMVNKFVYLASLCGPPELHELQVHDEIIPGDLTGVSAIDQDKEKPSNKRSAPSSSSPTPTTDKGEDIADMLSTPLSEVPWMNPDSWGILEGQAAKQEELVKAEAEDPLALDGDRHPNSGYGRPSPSDYRSVARHLLQTMKSALTFITDARKRLESAARDEMESAREAAQRNPSPEAEQLVRAAALKLAQYSRTHSMWSRPEIDSFRLLLRFGLVALDSGYAWEGVEGSEQRELLELFSQLFSFLGPTDFASVFSDAPAFLVARIRLNVSVLSVPTKLVESKVVTKPFVALLLDYIVDRLPSLRDVTKHNAAVIVRLFKLTFSSVSHVSSCETILRPRLQTIVITCFNCARDAKDPINYFAVLRHVFRCLSTGKYESVYQELVPLLSGILESLNRLQANAHAQNLKDLFVELALTVPVRLTHILTCLPLMLQPIRLALESASELAHFGLRLLETCVDGLDRPFLDPILEPVKDQILLALWRHAKPPPYKHGKIAAKVLGKLAGRNRDFYVSPEHLEFQLSSEMDKLTASLSIAEGVLDLPLDRCIRSARKYLLLSPDHLMRMQGFRLIQACFRSYLRCSDKVCMEQVQARLSVLLVQARKEGNEVGPCTWRPVAEVSRETEEDFFSLLEDEPEGSPPSRTQRSFDGQSQSLRTILKTLVMVSVFSGPELDKSVKSFCSSIFRHFSVLCMLYGSCEPVQKLETIDPYVYIDALVDVISGESFTYSQSGIRCLNLLLDTAVSFTSSLNEAARLPIFMELSHRFIRSCYRATWSRRHGGVIGLSHCIDTMPAAWLLRHATCIAEALLYVLAETQPEISLSTAPDASRALHNLIAACFGPVQDAERERRVRDNIIASYDTSVREAAEAAKKAAADAADDGSKEQQAAGGAESGASRRSSRTSSAKKPRRGQPMGSDVEDEEMHQDDKASSTRASEGRDGAVSDAGNATDAEDGEKGGSDEGANGDGEGDDDGVPDSASPDKREASGDSDADEILAPSGPKRRKIVCDLDDTSVTSQMLSFQQFSPSLGTEPNELVDDTYSVAPEILALREEVLPALVKVLATRLTSSSEEARTASMRGLESLAMVMNRDVASLLEPIDDVIFGLLRRDLDALPVLPAEVQAGKLDALKWMVGLYPPLESLGREDSPAQHLVVMAIRITMVEQALEPPATALRGAYGRGGTRAAVVHAVRLIGSLFDSPLASQLMPKELKPKAVTAVFMKLIVANDKVVEAADEALTAISVRRVLTKDEQSLRLILSVFANYRKLDVHLLRGLCRLLELMRNSFSYNIGKKVLEHLQQSIVTVRRMKGIVPENAPGHLPPLPSRSLDEEADIALALLEFFPRLTDRAFEYMEEVTKVTLELEAVFAGERRPAVWRSPLYRYYSAFAQEAATLFFAQMNVEAYSELLLDALRTPKWSGPLIEVLADNEELLVRYTFEAATSVLQSEQGEVHDRVRAAARYRMLGIILSEVIVASKPGWLASQKRLRDCLVTVWCESDMAQLALGQVMYDVPDATLQAMGRSSTINHDGAASLARCIVDILRVDGEDTDLLFRLSAYLTVRHAHAVDFVTDFFEEVTGSTSDGAPSTRPFISNALERQRRIFERFVYVFDQPSSPAMTHLVMVHLIIPTLATRCRARDVVSSIGEGVLSALAKALTAQQPVVEVKPGPPSPLVLKRHGPFGADVPTDSIRVASLQACLLLVWRGALTVSEVRKDIIRFAWRHLGHKDLITKHWGYVVIAHFVGVYETPSKITVQAFVALIRAHQSEVRPLVQKAITIMMPALPNKMSEDAGNEGGSGTATGGGEGSEVFQSSAPAHVDPNPIWIGWLRKVLSEEAHQFPQLQLLLQILVRFRTALYPYRRLFAPRVISQLAQIGLSPSSTVENRILAVDLAELIIRWDAQRVWNSMKAEGDQVEDDGYVPPLESQEVIINFLARVAALVDIKDSKARDGKEVNKAEPPESVALRARALKLLRRTLRLWHDAKVMFYFFEKVVRALLHSHGSVVVHGTKVLLAVSEIRSDQFASELKILGKPILDALPSTEKGVTDAVLPLLKLIITKFPKSTVMKAVEATEAAKAAAAQQAGSDDEAMDEGDDEKPAAPATPEEARYATLKVFYDELHKTIVEGISSTWAAGNTEHETTSMHKAAVSLAVLELLTDVEPNEIDTYQALLVEALQSLSHSPDQLAAPKLPSDAKDREGKQSSVDRNTRLLKNVSRSKPLSRVVRLLGLVHKLDPSQRQVAVASLSHLFERSGDSELVKGVVQLLQTWIIPADELATLEEEAANETGSPRVNLVKTPPRGPDGRPVVREPMLSLVEAVNMTLKMARLVERASSISLQSMYLNTLFVVYRNTVEAGSTSLSASLEPCILSAWRCRMLTFGSKFFAIFRQRTDSTIFGRLDHVFRKQDWSPLAKNYWIRQALELMIAPPAPTEVDAESRLTMKRGTARLISLCEASSRSVAKVEDEEMIDIGDRAAVGGGAAGAATNDERFAVASQALMDEHVEWFKGAREPVHVDDLLSCVRDLVHQDVGLASSLWSVLFPQWWVLITEEQREQLTQSMTRLLSQKYHLHQRSTPNCMETILFGFARCDQPPRIPPDLITYLGESFSALHPAVSIIERWAMEGMGGTADGSSALWLAPSQAVPRNKREEAVYDALAQLYSKLREDDMWIGLWQRRAAQKATVNALSLEQRGSWQRAADAYYLAMELEMSGAIASVPAAETSLWEQRWIDCARRLNQWDLLAEYAQQVGATDLAIESAWRVHDWNMTRDTLAARPVAEDGLDQKVYRAFIAYHAKQAKEVEVLHDAGVAQALRMWSSLQSTSIQARLPILQKFQLLVELKEGLWVLKETEALQQATSSGTTSSRSAGSPTEVKSRLGSWRERLPNEWEDVCVWAELMTWRQLVYQQISSAYAKVDNQNHLGHHEMAWSINKLARVSRKHDLSSMCLTLLNQIYKLPNIEIVDAFVKLKEQARVYFEMPEYHPKGLDVISSTNLDFFGIEQKAEFFRLKGEFLSRMGRAVAANEAFAVAVSLFENLAAGWVSWGRFCDAQFDFANVPVLAESAMMCYLEAIRADATKGASHIPRVLALVRSFPDPGASVGEPGASGPAAITAGGDASKAGAEPGSVSKLDAKRSLLKLFGERAATVAPWVWLPWRNELIDGLGRPEGAAFHRILCRIAAKYSQALFWPLEARVKLLAARGVPVLDGPMTTARKLLEEAPSRNNSNNVDYSQPQAEDSNPDVNSATEAARMRTFCEIALLWIGQAKPTVVSAMRALGDTIENAVPVAALELHESVDTLVSECRRNVPVVQLAASVATLWQRAQELEAARVADEVDQAHGRVLDGEVFAAVKDRLAALAGGASGKSAAELEGDLLAIESMVRARLPESLNLAAAASGYRSFAEDFARLPLEVPGQYTFDGGKDEVNPYYFALVEGVSPEATRVVLGTSVEYSIVFLGSDGQLHLLNARSSAPSAHSLRRREARAAGFLGTAARMVAVERRSRSRYLYVAHENALDVGPSLRLVRSDVRHQSFADYERLHYMRRGLGPNEVLWAFAGGMSLAEIEARYVPRNSLNNLLSVTFPSSSALFEFRQQILSQFGVLSTLAYGVASPTPEPSDIRFSGATGELHNMRFRPAVAINEPNGVVVPFRLTPCFVQFLTPVGIIGRFMAVVQATAAALLSRRSKLSERLVDVLWDDVFERTAASRGTSGTFDWYADVSSEVSTVTRELAARADERIAALDYELDASKVTDTPSPLQALISQSVGEQLAHAPPAFRPWW
jgi:hypothetical protein